MSMLGMVAGIVIILLLKWVIKTGLTDTLANALSGGGGNRIISAIMHILAPGIIALLFLIAAVYISPSCPQAGIFLTVVAVVVGGILGLGIAYFATSIPFLGPVLAPAVAPIIPVFWLLLAIAIIELVITIALPIILPGAGLVIAMIIPFIFTIVMVFILAGYAGNLFDILTCVKQASSSGFLIEIQKKIFGGAWIGTSVPKLP